MFEGGESVSAVPISFRRQPVRLKPLRPDSLAAADAMDLGLGGPYKMCLRMMLSGGRRGVCCPLGSRRASSSPLFTLRVPLERSYVYYFCVHPLVGLVLESLSV